MNNTITKNASIILEKRYLGQNEEGQIIETPSGMFERVAANIALADLLYNKDYADVSKSAEEFYGIMNSLKFLPNSPTLMNAGKPLQMCSACFVLPVYDSIEEIFESIKNAALIHKAGGGTGFDFSRIRAENANVKSTNGIASGPVSFLKVFNAATDVIKQGSKRRGANMAVLRCDHPDIVKFIEAKQKEGDFSNFNFSVAITDTFIEAYRNNSYYNLIDPHTNKVVQPISAKYVFELIAEHAHSNGEPGMIFIDTMNKDNPVPLFDTIRATNPCVTGDTPILTSTGYVRIKDVEGRQVEVWNGEEFSPVIPTVTGVFQDMLRVTFSDGSDLDCTLYHKFCIELSKDNRHSDVMRIEAKDLEPGMKLERFSYPVIEGTISLSEMEAYTKGVFCGDGSIETLRDRQSIWLYDDKIKLLPYLLQDSHNICANGRIMVKMPKGEWAKDWVPSTEYTIKTRLDWLAGILDTDAGFTSYGGYAIWSIDKNFLMNTKYMLHTLGVGATLTLGKKAQNKMMPDGKGGQKEYSTKDCWRLSISGSSIEKLVNLGLTTKRIDVSHKVITPKNRLIEIVSVEPIENEETVYCFTEEKRHKGMFGCVAIGNCGEQPLYDYESCTLGSINLSKFVIDGSFDWADFKRTVEIAVHFLDNVLDMNKYPLAAIEEKTKKCRKIGLGVMGFHDMLLKLKIKYNSQKCLDMIDQIGGFMNEVGIAKSVKLAEERGPFSEFSQSIFKDQAPRRNATLFSIAPTGTISIIGNCSSSIEPIFAYTITRNHDLTDGQLLIEANSVFEQILRKNNLYSDELIKQVSVHGSCQEVESLPQELKDIFVSAHDISPEWHIKIQAQWQKYVDAAISKTCNLPFEATVEDVIDSYLQAFDSGCKGVTVYRNGSRDNQVLYAGIVEKKDMIDGQLTIKEVLPEVIEPGTLFDHTCPSCGEVFKVAYGTCAWCPKCGQKECSS